MNILIHQKYYAQKNMFGKNLHKTYQFKSNGFVGRIEASLFYTSLLN